jgi:murein DD-endopeptidase MepM/ murein hydrolase activator NlpD
MTRVGWVVLVGILLIAGLFASTLSFSGRVARQVVPPARLLTTPALPSTMATGANGMPVLSVPVAGVSRQQIVDTWGQARGGGRGHHGTDIMAPGGTRVFAVAPGVIEKLFQSRLGGVTLYQRSPDRRWTFYYAHLARYAPGLREGQRVRAGELLGFVGDTGDAGPGNYHLHFSAARLGPDQRWWQGQDVNAYPMLTGRR